MMHSDCRSLCSCSVIQLTPLPFKGLIFLTRDFTCNNLGVDDVDVGSIRDLYSIVGCVTGQSLNSESCDSQEMIIGVKSMCIFSIDIAPQNIYSYYIFANIMLMGLMFSINSTGKYTF